MFSKLVATDGDVVVGDGVSNLLRQMALTTMKRVCRRLVLNYEVTPFGHII